MISRACSTSTNETKRRSQSSIQWLCAIFAASCYMPFRANAPWWNACSRAAWPLFRLRHKDFGWPAVISVPATPKTRSQLESLRSEADTALRLAIDHRLSQLATAPPPLNDAAQVLVQKSMVEQDHEERFGTAPKLLSRDTRATQLIIVLNLAMFAVEIFQGGSTNMETLYRLGALYAPAVRGGEWWRLPASMFLHLGPVHLAMNMVALWVLGPFTEFALGFRRFLFTYLISGLGSMAVVCALASGQAAEQLTVGASGSIMGLVGATGALMLRGWLRHKASVARRRLAGMVTILVAQSAFDALVPQVSMKAHLSGAAIGFLMTLLLRDRLKPEGG